MGEQAGVEQAERAVEFACERETIASDSFEGNETTETARLTLAIHPQQIAYLSDSTTRVVQSKTNRPTIALPPSGNIRKG